MKKIEKQELGLIKPLFKGIGDSMVIAYLQGKMGDGWVDRMPGPQAGLIVSGEYSFFAGDAASPGAEAFARDAFRYIGGDFTTAIFADGEPGWKDLLLSFPENNPEAVPRYGIVQRDYDFDESLLSRYVSEMPEGFLLKGFDKELYEEAMKDGWSREFCEGFSSADDFVSRGFGYAAINDGRLVSGASTMTVYDGGEETQVATHPDFRKRGLARACSAALLLECQRRGVRACWDAANQASLHLALSLGYEYRGEYTVVLMKRGG